MTGIAIAPRTARSRLRTSIACNIGAAFEWYDLVLYGLFAVVLSKQFFPSGSASTSLTLSLGAFAIAYLVRPLGAMVIGAYADRNGRKSGLLLSAGLMMLGILVTAVLPNYQAIGIAAPILMVLAPCSRNRTRRVAASMPACNGRAPASPCCWHRLPPMP
jgi:MHS family proline/betaine transporter-like MFS transporter